MGELPGRSYRAGGGVTVTGRRNRPRAERPITSAPVAMARAAGGSTRETSDV
jgi:hypothetical protein